VGGLLRRAIRPCSRCWSRRRRRRLQHGARSTAPAARRPHHGARITAPASLRPLHGARLTW